MVVHKRTWAVTQRSTESKGLRIYKRKRKKEEKKPKQGKRPRNTGLYFGCQFLMSSARKSAVSSGKVQYPELRNSIKGVRGFRDILEEEAAACSLIKK